jgi:serine phosphatase RsbU (regulator of sigma subunit)
VLDPEKKELVTVNAGHNPTYLRHRDNTLEDLTIGGIPLGMMREAPPYQSTKFILKPGDSVLYYTDGVTEAMNEKEEQYDDLRPLKNFLSSNKTHTARDFIDELIADVNDFTGSTPQSDDITALYLLKSEE